MIPSCRTTVRRQSRGLLPRHKTHDVGHIERATLQQEDYGRSCPQETGQPESKRPTQESAPRRCRREIHQSTPSATTIQTAINRCSAQKHCTCYFRTMPEHFENTRSPKQVAYTHTEVSPGKTREPTGPPVQCQYTARTPVGNRGNKHRMQLPDAFTHGLHRTCFKPSQPYL